MLLGAAEVVATQHTANESNCSIPLEDKAEAFMSVYTAGLAELCRWIVVANRGSNGASNKSEAGNTDHHHPLASALSLSPPHLARPVFQSLTSMLGRLETISPPQPPATLICPIATSIIYQPECKQFDTHYPPPALLE